MNFHISVPDIAKNRIRKLSETKEMKQVMKLIYINILTLYL